MNSINVSNHHDVVSFCYLRLDPPQVTKIMRLNAQGLSQVEVCEESLRNGHYIPVLSAVWGEKNKVLRLDWLRSRALELHAPLMFEQAIAEFVNSPNTETVIRISLPLIRAASFRVYQDSACCKDLSVCSEGGSAQMETIYMQALERTMKKYAPKLSIEEIQSKNQAEIQLERIELLRKIVERSIEAPEEFPNPTWISYHGMEAIFGSSKMHPASEFGNKRKEVAEKVLPQLNR